MLARNLRVGRGEIDLLVRVDGVVVAVEVKTRVGEDPAVQLTETKLARMRAAADLVEPRPRRIDLVSVRVDPDGAFIRWVRGIA